MRNVLELFQLPNKEMCHHQEILLSSSNFYSLTASGKAHLHIVSNHMYVHYQISGKSTSAALLSLSHDCLQSLDN